MDVATFVTVTTAAKSELHEYENVCRGQCCDYYVGHLTRNPTTLTANNDNNNKPVLSDFANQVLGYAD